MSFTAKNNMIGSFSDGAESRSKNCEYLCESAKAYTIFSVNTQGGKVGLIYFLKNWSAKISWTVLFYESVDHWNFFLTFFKFFKNIKVTIEVKQHCVTTIGYRIEGLVATIGYRIEGLIATIGYRIEGFV